MERYPMPNIQAGLLLSLHLFYAKKADYIDNKNNLTKGYVYVISRQFTELRLLEDEIQTGDRR